MAPAVPFALLGVVQLLAVAGWLALAGASMFPRLRRRATVALAAGAFVMAAADVVTAIDFGTPSSDAVGWLRVAGLVLLGVGVGRGAAQSRALVLPTSVAGVVVPLGSQPAPAYVAGAVGLVAAVAAWRRGRRPGADRLLGSALAAALLLTGVAAALAEPAASSSTAAVAALAVRAVATIAVAAAVVQIGRSALLGKLASAILAGVLAVAAGAVGVVGTGVAADVQSQQVQRLRQVADTELRALQLQTTLRAGLFAELVTRCFPQPQQCPSLLSFFRENSSYFGAAVYPGGAKLLASDPPGLLGNTALVALAGTSAVQDVLQPLHNATATSGGLMLLPGHPPILAVVEAASGRPNGSVDARVRPTFAGVYGIVLNDAFTDLLKETTSFDFSLIADGTVLASSLRGDARTAVLRAAGDVEHADVGASRVVTASGTTPTVVYVGVQDPNSDTRIATLAVSQRADAALRAQRSVLQRMFFTALAALVLSMGLALLLARRIADPVRRLTVAAGRVRRGDLETRTPIVSSRDEVGSLARAFDAMTASLRQATGDLRAAADQEAALRARMETVVASMSDGLVVTDADGVVTAVNVTAAQLLDVDAERAVGQPLGDVVDVRGADGRPLLDGDRSASRRAVDGVLHSASGRTVPVRVSSSPLGDRQGDVLVIADRTREHEVERMKTEFLANVSHELRTPLTPIRGYAELLARRPDLDRGKVDLFVAEILSSTARMSRVVELLVDVATLEGGRVAPTLVRMPVKGLVEGRLAKWQATYPERAADMKRRVATKLPPVAVDSRWVTRALDELADNAVKYTAPGSTITIAAALADDGAHVRVSVRDTGPGFDHALAAELVGDFSQADASETRRVGGMGLGLGFVNRVAARFGLGFTVDAEPGKGAEFALLLPVWNGRGR